MELSPSGAAGDPHAPTGNLAPAGADAFKEGAVPLLEQGSPGSFPGTQPLDGEVEDVPGRPAPVARMLAMDDGGAAVPQFMAAAPATGGLRDIGEASFGPPIGLETVHGPDNRVQITGTNLYPWRAIASLLITAADNSQWIGTGWFIGPRTLATAGHCVCIKGSGVPGRDGWVKRIVVMAGRNGGVMPYGAVTSTVFRSVQGWSDSGKEEYDYGAIILPTPLGSTVGWYGLTVQGDADLVGKPLNVAGYPGDKPAGTMWYDAGTIASVGPRKIYYDIDTAGGQSGAPAYRVINDQRYGVGIHTYGGPTTNSATRITKPVFDNLVAWKA